MWLTFIFGLTIFTSSFLLFQVQPMIAKLILPRLGGSAATWTVCLLFFQAMLLLGYTYSHVLIRYFSRRTQGRVHLLLLISSAVALSFAFDVDGLELGLGDSSPELIVFVLLASSVGLPYFALSTTGPLIQAWYSADKGTSERSVPYRLFALSNLGSMLALLSYPLVIEPFAPMVQQTTFWMFGFVLFVVACAVLSIRPARKSTIDSSVSSNDESRRVADVTRPTWIQMTLWMGLAACPSIWLMAVTSHLTKDVAPVPLLWILPLALYLLTFILCFESDRWYRRAAFLPLFLVGIGVLFWLQPKQPGDYEVLTVVPLYLFFSFVLFMVGHGELARHRPAPRDLTTFFLMTALGGFLGGVFVGVVAPRVFLTEAEYPIALIATAIWATVALFKDRDFFVHRAPFGLGWASIALALIWLAHHSVNAQTSLSNDARFMARNFYGTLKVKEAPAFHSQKTLVHGAIVHGEQFQTSERRRWPTTYYAEGSGVELAIRQSREKNRPQRVGVIGLGTGTVAAYGRKGDLYRFYEINPLVADIAKREFTFLSDSEAKIEVALGDARILLEREGKGHYDTLIVDAFSGDSIPVHLLTKEAFGIFLGHLEPDGILAVHVSNQFLNLTPIVRRLASLHGKISNLIESKDHGNRGAYGSSWVLVMARPRLGIELRSPLFSESELVDVPVWTDDFSSLYSVMK